MRTQRHGARPGPSSGRLALAAWPVPRPPVPVAGPFAWRSLAIQQFPARPLVPVRHVPSPALLSSLVPSAGSPRGTRPPRPRRARGRRAVGSRRRRFLPPSRLRCAIDNSDGEYMPARRRSRPRASSPSMLFCCCGHLVSACMPSLLWRQGPSLFAARVLFSKPRGLV